MKKNGKEMFFEPSLAGHEQPSARGLVEMGFALRDWLQKRGLRSPLEEQISAIHARRAAERRARQ